MQKMQKFLCLALLAALLLGCEKDDDTVPAPTYVPLGQQALPTENMTIAGELFTLELAYTRASRTRGYMFREHIGPGEGMFFVFRRPQIQSFYMKNCLVDLDILFIKDDGAIDKIATMKVPRPGQPLKTYPSTSPVRFVLELAAGTSRRLGLQAGQKLQLPQRMYQIIPD